MSDFDFDEIDKAVNSALNSQASAGSDNSRSSLTVPSRDTSSVAPQRPAVSTVSPSSSADRDASNNVSTDVAPTDADINQTMSSIIKDVDTNASVADGAMDNPVDSPDVSNTEKPGLPTRRSGRFMDIVHPSSDMSTTSMAPRKSPSIDPVSTDTTETDPEVTTVSDAMAAMSEVADEVTPANSALKPEDVPPPIDLDKPVNTELTSQIDSLLAGDGGVSTVSESVTQPPQTQPPVIETEAPVDTPQQEDSGLDFEETPDKEKPQEPQTSPFLEGVSVDKRPLGDGNAVDTMVDETLEPTAAPTEDAPVAPDDNRKAGYSEELKHPDDVTAAEILPDELNNKLVSIESSDNVDTKYDSPENVTPPTPDAAASAGPTSIPKQYKEKERTDDDASNDIFDTKNYHKPIKEEAKKGMSPVLLTIIILVVVLLVAGGIFAAWWMKLFTLPF